VLVKTKNGEFRFAIDYRKLNAVTQPITYPLPRLDDLFDAIGQANATIYTKLDLTSAYFIISIMAITTTFVNAILIFWL
jgi:hypothetical protein